MKPNVQEGVRIYEYSRDEGSGPSGCTQQPQEGTRGNELTHLPQRGRHLGEHGGAVQWDGPLPSSPLAR